MKTNTTKTLTKTALASLVLIGLCATVHAVTPKHGPPSGGNPGSGGTNAPPPIIGTNTPPPIGGTNCPPPPPPPPIGSTNTPPPIGGTNCPPPPPPPPGGGTNGPSRGNPPSGNK